MKKRKQAKELKVTYVYVNDKDSEERLNQAIKYLNDDLIANISKYEIKK